MEYSPTVTLVPPRLSGRLHSLTDWSQVRLVLGRPAMMSGTSASRQPQSQAITLAFGEAAWTAFSMVALTSAMIAAAVRSLQRGQASWLWCEAQLVKFSEAVMVKTPPRSGTCLKTWEREAASQFRTAGLLVQRAKWSPSRTPRTLVRSGSGWLKNSAGMA